MKKTTLILSLIFIGSLFSRERDSSSLNEPPINKERKSQQNRRIDSIIEDLNIQKIRNEKQSALLSNLNAESTNLRTSIDSLSGLISTNSRDIVKNSQSLGSKIQETEQRAESKISGLDGDIEKNRLYWIIATLSTVLLGGIIYWLLGKRISSNHTNMETQIRNTKASLIEEGVNLDNKLVNVLEKQLKLQQEKSNAQPSVSTADVDHSLALKVADEVIRIQKNLSRMDDSTKGLKQLNSSVQRIQDNFASNGYELVDMLGKEYNEGMKATVNFVQDENLDDGKRIITRIIKPQVNFNGEMIQTAQIEVSEA